MTTLETYIQANFDILANSLDNVIEYKNKNNLEMMISQLETLAGQAKSFADYLKLKAKFG